jgi:sporulation related protein/surface-adhesin protein E
MKKRIIVLQIFFTIISFSSLLSQELSDSWKLIKSDVISDILIEPSNIIEYGNEISVWSIERLKEPKNSENYEKIFSIKTHYLFNKMKKRYAEIGVLYYDDRGGIINRSSKSSFSAGPSAFMTQISYNPNAEIIYNEVISYLISGNIATVEYNSDKNYEKVGSFETPDNLINLVDRKEVLGDPKSEIIAPFVIEEKNNEKNSPILIIENNKTDENLSKADISEESWNEIPKIEERFEINEKPTVKSLASLREFNKTDLFGAINIVVDKEKAYNLSNERALKNAIFTDGNLFCIQVSSWKTKSYADRELNKLLAKGYNTFLVSVKPKHKNSIWHRVRVGYFNTFQQAQSIQREIKRN